MAWWTLLTFRLSMKAALLTNARTRRLSAGSDATASVSVLSSTSGSIASLTTCIAATEIG